MGEKKSKRGHHKPPMLTEMIFVRISKELKKEFCQAALEEGFSASDLSRSLLSKYLIERRILRMKLKESEKEDQP